jgi:hypothetical protein
MKDVIYFPHEANASRDEKMSYLLKKHGFSGYGVFWFIAEMMHESRDSKLSLSLIDGYPTYNTDITLLKDVIATCFDCGLFRKDDKSFWSDRVIRNKEEREKKRLLKSLAGQKGMSIRWKDNAVKQADNKHNKVKESKVKESKEETKDVSLITSQGDVAQAPPALTFPVAGKSEQWPLTKELVREYQKAFPDLDIVAVSQKAKTWLITKGHLKTYRGMGQFLFRWFDKEQNGFKGARPVKEKLVL